MYDNQYATTPVPEQPRTIITQAINQELAEQNKWQSELISTIESKLHSILNLRTPEKGDTSQAPNIPIQDFAKSMELQLATMRINSNRLNKIIDHLNQIV